MPVFFVSNRHTKKKMIFYKLHYVVAWRYCHVSVSNYFCGAPTVGGLNGQTVISERTGNVHLTSCSRDTDKPLRQSTIINSGAFRRSVESKIRPQGVASCRRLSYCCSPPNVGTCKTVLATMIEYSTAYRPLVIAPAAADIRQRTDEWAKQ